MKNWVSRCAALMGTVLSLSSFAQDCQEVSLYKNGEEGKLEESLNTFPEKPEWVTNWGDMDGMIPPYIRFSGMKNKVEDWTGILSFDALPQKVKGGVLKARVRTSQKGKVGFWLQGPFGSSSIAFNTLEPNKTTLIEIPVSNLVGNATTQIDKIGIGLFDVPAYQYTILFVDDVVLSCGEKVLTQMTADSVQKYVYSDIAAGVAAREGKFSKSGYPQTSAAYSAEERSQIAATTNANFVMGESEHQQIEDFIKAVSLTPLQSHKGWFRNMYFLDHHRLKDSVIANPKALLYEAQIFTAEEENRAMPILMGNVDYAYRICADSSCESTTLRYSRLLQANLPTAFVRGSKIRLFYDPYFVSTNRKNLPALEIFTNNRWNTVDPNSEITMEFDGAGVQKIQVRLSEGGLVVNQNLFVEVK